MSAHSHVQRLQYLQQQQAQQQHHMASLPPHMRGGSNPPSVASGYTPNRASMGSVGYASGGGGGAGYVPQPQARASMGSIGNASGGGGYVPQPQSRASMGSVGYAAHGHRPGLYSAHSQGSLNSQPASVMTFGARSTGRPYQQTNLKASRSLGASRASLATQRSTIQQEHRDRRVRKKMVRPWYGKARTPFIIAVVLYSLAVIMILAGLILTIMASQGRIFIPMDNARALGPIVLALGVLLAFVGIKFVHDAYKINAAERGRLKFRAHNASMISINTQGSRHEERDDAGEGLVSGGATKNAVTRTPAGSRSSLANIP